MKASEEPISATLQRMLEKEMGARRPKRRLFSRMLGRQSGTSQAAQATRSGDLTIAALGLTLGLICALFPWYIFFNQDTFGIKAMKFSGSGEAVGRLTVADQPQRIGAPMQVEEIPELELDLFATATLPDRDGERDFIPPGVDEQPFPVPDPVFKLVHVANGRAMIEDDSGIWVVQRGSKLPDNSFVASIELKDGDWVVVTSEERVIGLE
jgi:hypothetical protein